MALIKCSECGKEVSDKATSCPNCGCPINSEISDVLTSNDDFHRTLKMEAVKQGKSMKQYVTELIEKDVQKEKE